MKKNILLLCLSLPLLNACIGLTFDDIFNPNLPTWERVSARTEGKPTQKKISDRDGGIVFRRTEVPTTKVASAKKVPEVVECLRQQMVKRFNLPEDFYEIRSYDNGAAGLQLVNPYNRKRGLYIDVLPQREGSELRLYANRTTMSGAWKSLPEKCR